MSMLSAVCILTVSACSDAPVSSDGDDETRRPSPSADAGGAKPRADAGSQDKDPPVGQVARDAGARDAGARGRDAETGKTDEADVEATVTPSDAGGGVTEPAPSAGTCGTGKRNDRPFGCDFAFGTNDPDGALGDFGKLPFLSKWVGWELEKDGTFARCEGCTWLTSRLAGQSATPVYYAYFIGYLGSANGFADQNVNPNGPNLATDGAKLLRAKRAEVVAMYASYAEQTARVWPDRPLVWLLEGDFVQYTYKEQKSPLSMAELGQLARDITCAIKGNMPNAVVAINHSTWLSDEVTDSFWEAMSEADYDLVWTTGVANNNGFFEAKAGPSEYNAKTANYAYVAQKTGRKILVDTSFGLSEMSDTWVSAPAATLDQRISEGVLAANVTKPAAGYVATSAALTEQLQPVCK